MIIDPSRPVPTVSGAEVNGDFVSGRPGKFSFVLDRDAIVTVTVEYELVPGEWREVDVAVNHQFLEQPGRYTLRWKADAGGPVPPGRYRFKIVARATGGVAGQGAAAARATDDGRRPGREPVPVARAEGPPTYQEFLVARVVGGPSVFAGPAGAEVIARPGGGILSVADARGNRLRDFSTITGAGGRAIPDLSEPRDVDYREPYYYVASAGTRRVLRLRILGPDPGADDGSKQGSIERSAFGGPGTGPGQFSPAKGPQSLAVGDAGGGRIYVVDGDLPRIQAFDLDGVLRETLTPPGLDDPNGIAVAPDGTLWVTDPAARRVFQVSTSGELLASVPANGVGGVDTDRAGPVLITDRTRRLALAVRPGAGTLEFGRNLLLGPTGITAAGLAGDVFVADDVRREVLWYRVP